MENATTAETTIDATKSKFKGMIFTGFDGETFQIRETHTGLVKLKNALREHLCVVYVKRYRDKKGRVTQIQAIAISTRAADDSQRELFSYTGTPKTIEPLLLGHVVREKL